MLRSLSGSEHGWVFSVSVTKDSSQEFNLVFNRKSLAGRFLCRVEPACHEMLDALLGRSKVFYNFTGNEENKNGGNEGGYYYPCYI